MKNIKKIVAGGLVVVSIMGALVFVGIKENTNNENSQMNCGIDPPSLPW